MQITPHRIRQQMGAAGHSVNSLAEATAIPRMTLTRRLADPSTITLGELDRIAAALGTTARHLAIDVPEARDRDSRAEAS